MNRMEEYRRLLTELEATPPALEYTLQRAKARRRHGLWKKGLGIPAGSLAAVFAAFVLLVNVSTPFALACSNVPFLKDLTAAVAFSPSLKAAVEHDFVQYIGQTQTQNGITMTLDYLIPDQGHRHRAGGDGVLSGPPRLHGRIGGGAGRLLLQQPQH